MGSNKMAFNISPETRTAALANQAAYLQGVASGATDPIKHSKTAPPEQLAQNTSTANNGFNIIG
jgi:hypothetical protein